MILAVDIGNSNICIGGLDGMKVLFTARMVTRPRCTGDEYRRAEISAGPPWRYP